MKKKEQEEDNMKTLDIMFKIIMCFIGIIVLTNLIPTRSLPEQISMGIATVFLGIYSVYITFKHSGVIK